MNLRYTRSSTFLLTAVLLTACGGSKGGGMLPIGPEGNNGGQKPTAAYLGGAVVQSSKLQLPGAALGTPDQNTEVGETVACINETGELNHLEIYEYYEARELTSTNISLGAQSDDPWARVADALSKINHLDPDLVTKLVGISTALKASMRLLPSAKLLSYPMKDSVISLPANCFLLQAAMLNIDYEGSQFSFLVDKTIWEAMNSDQKTGLILHETLKLHYGVRFLVTTDASGDGRAMPQGPHDHDMGQDVVMNHKRFRQAHLNYVNIDSGLRTLDFIAYLSAIGQVGHNSIKIGEHHYRPNGKIEFYNAEERKVKSGYLAQEATIPSPSPLFKELTVDGQVSFYESGKLKSAVVGQPVTSSADGVPSQLHLYQAWPLTQGGNGYLHGQTSFGEDGQLLEVNFGFLNQSVKIKTNRFDLIVEKNSSGTDGGVIHVNEVQSFDLTAGEEHCRRCTGTMNAGGVNPALSFSNATIAPLGSSGHEISGSTEAIAFNLADGSKLRSQGKLVVDLLGHVSSVDGLEGSSIVCASGDPVRNFGRIKFNRLGKIESIGDQKICSDYKFVVSAP